MSGSRDFAHRFEEYEARDLLGRQLLICTELESSEQMPNQDIGFCSPECSGNTEAPVQFRCFSAGRWRGRTRRAVKGTGLRLNEEPANSGYSDRSRLRPWVGRHRCRKGSSDGRSKLEQACQSAGLQHNLALCDLFVCKSRNHHDHDDRKLEGGSTPTALAIRVRRVNGSSLSASACMNIYR